MTFVAPDVRNPGPYTECYACGARKIQHGPDGACPWDEDENDDTEDDA